MGSEDRRTITTLEAGMVWLKLVSDEARVDIGSFCFLGAGTDLDAIDRISFGSRTVIAPAVSSRITTMG